MIKCVLCTTRFDGGGSVCPSCQADRELGRELRCLWSSRDGVDSLWISLCHIPGGALEVEALEAGIPRNVERLRNALRLALKVATA